VRHATHSTKTMTASKHVCLPCVNRDPVPSEPSLPAQATPDADEPKSLICPITKSLFRDPVIVPESGYTYEKKALVRHLKGPRKKDPITQQHVTGEFQVNRAIRDAVAEWLHRHPGIIPHGWDTRDPENESSSLPRPSQGCKQLHAWRTLRETIRRCHSLRGKNPELIRRCTLITDSNMFVKEIHLTGLRLRQIPNEVYVFKTLESLFIDDNMISKLSPKISLLTNLRVLNASNNLLRKLPEEVCDLKNVQTLNFNDNGLMSLPKSINSLRELRELHVCNNRLEYLAINSDALPVLRRVYVAGNPLKHVAHTLDTDVIM